MSNILLNLMQLIISCLLYNLASVITRAQLDAAKKLAKVCCSGISASGEMVCESGSLKLGEKTTLFGWKKRISFTLHV